MDLVSAHRCTCLSDDSPLCRYCWWKHEAQEYAAEEVVPEYVTDAAAAHELWGGR